MTFFQIILTSSYLNLSLEGIAERISVRMKLSKEYLRSVKKQSNTMNYDSS